MTEREIERFLQEGRRRLAEQRNLELRKRIASRRSGELKVLQTTCSLTAEKGKIGELALIS